MRNWLLYHILIVLSFTGCTLEPKNDLTETGETGEILAIPEETVYIIDTATSIITWVGSSPTERHNGIFKIKEGSISISVTGNPADSQSVKVPVKKNLDRINQAQIVIGINSVDILDLKYDRVQYNRLLRHLKSDDFFQAAQFPEATFELTSIERIEKDTAERIVNEFTIINPTHKVKGDLTIKGITRSISFPVKLGLINLKLEASAKFKIDRTFWKIDTRNTNDPEPLARDNFINDFVNVGFEIIAYTQDP